MLKSILSLTMIIGLTACAQSVHQIKNNEPVVTTSIKGNLDVISSCIANGIEEREGSPLFGYPNVPVRVNSKTNYDVITKDASTGITFYVVNLDKRNSTVHANVSRMNGKALFGNESFNTDLTKMIEKCSS